jgi:hypothetical protein
MHFRIVLPVVFFLLVSQSFGQHFSNVAAQSGLDFMTTHSHWGCGVSFYDWNKDGWPDLSMARTGGPPRFFRNDNGIFVEEFFDIPNTHEMKTIQWVDYDNDGDPDLFVTRYLGFWSLYRNEGDFSFTDVTEEAGIFQVLNPRTYGASWGDTDNDGWLDLYITNYNTQFNSPGTTVTNYFFRNNADGTFTEMGVELGIDNGIDFSFQAAFIDVNRDGWQDIYVINDRFLSDNTLYLNNGDGTFTDVSASSGSGIIIDSMSITVGDYDNNGSLDIYITNTYEGNALLKNDGQGFFTEEAGAAGVTVGAWCWGAQFLDYNMDGWKDLYVPTGAISNFATQNYFYSNNGNGTFNYEFLSGFQGVNTISHASAVGDFDNDGDPDLIVSNRAPLSASLFRNNTSGKNYLKVSLEGVVSNKDGIGGFIECHAGGMTQTAYTLCGESFISQNSQYQIFGLDGIEVVDSLIIHWLGGVVDKYYQPAINTWHHCVEGASTVVSFGFDNNHVFLCAGDSLTISPGSFSAYDWSTGETDSFLTISEGGTYSVTVTDSFGIQHVSPILTVEMVEEVSYDLTLSGGVCPGDAVDVSIANLSVFGAMAFWDGIELTDSLQVEQPGVYELVIQVGSCLFSEEISIELPSAIQFEWTKTNALCFDSPSGTVAVSELVGGTGALVWTIEPPMAADSLLAGTYVLTVWDESGCSVSQLFDIQEPAPLEIGFVVVPTEAGSPTGSVQTTVEGGTPPYQFVWSSGDSGPDLMSMPEGVYAVIVTDANGCSQSAEAEIPLTIPGADRQCLPVVSGGLIRFPCPEAFRALSVFSLNGQLIQKSERIEEKLHLVPEAKGPVVVLFLLSDGREIILKGLIR